MTAAALYQAMIVITANAVTATIVVSVQRIARCAIRHFVWDVLMNVPHVMSLFARDVQPNARNAKKYFVRIV